MFNSQSNFPFPPNSSSNEVSNEQFDFVMSWAPPSQYDAFISTPNDEAQGIAYAIIEEVLTEMDEDRRRAYINTDEHERREALYNQQMLLTYGTEQMRQKYQNALQQGKHQQLADQFAEFFASLTQEEQLDWSIRVVDPNYVEPHDRAFTEYQRQQLQLNQQSFEEESNISDETDSLDLSDLRTPGPNVEPAPTISEHSFSDWTESDPRFTESELAPSEDYSDMTDSDFAPSESERSMPESIDSDDETVYTEDLPEESIEPSVSPVGEEHGLDLGSDLSEVSNQQFEEDGWFNDEYDPELDELPEIPDVPQPYQRQRNQSIDLGGNPSNASTAPTECGAKLKPHSA